MPDNRNLAPGIQFVRPIPFQEAIDKIGGQTLIGSQMNSAEWADVPVMLRDSSLFSSTVESVRFLQRGKDGFTDFLAGARETLPNGETALKLGSRQDFIKQLQEFALKEGMGPLDPKDKGTLKDITSERRLGLIFDTKIRQAQDYGGWKQGMDPDVLDAFPAQRFIRVIDVEEPRDAHSPYEDQVALKSDLDFWIRINEDFGVPWGPWGWGCGHDVEDVDRGEAEELGLLEPGAAVEPVEMDLNERLQAGTGGLEPDLLAKLKEELGDQVQIDDDTIQWKGNTDERDRSAARRDRPAGRADDREPADPRAVAQAGRRIFADVRSRDTGTPLDPGTAQEGGAHLAAVATGRKPLYHDQWGDELGSDLFRRLTSTLPPNVEVVFKDGHLYAYRPEVIQEIIARDPQSYPGADLFEKIHDATLAGENGELLGYGARSMAEPGTVRVSVLDAEEHVVFGFRSRPEAAEAAGLERARDFVDAYGREFSYQIQR